MVIIIGPITGNMDTYEREAFLEGCRLIAGVDEAGRGPLAGPVVAASVIFPSPIPPRLKLLGINDSKKLTPLMRGRLAPVIKEHAAAFGIGIVEPSEIDAINIRQASLLAMRKAVANMGTRPDILLIDGPSPIGADIDIRERPIVRGDGLSISIAAASIIAKTARDAIMDECHAVYPQYDFIHNKGYGTEKHLAALRAHGACPAHRMTFKGVRKDADL